MQMYRSRLLASSLLVSAAVIAQPALAQVAEPATSATAAATQDNQQPTDASTEGEVVVTGSLIRNPNLQTSSPVNVIGQDEVRLRQTNTAEDILKQTPGVTANIGSSTNNGNVGASFVDLRGLGPNRNIVLLDGARIVPSGLTGQVDLNNIPLSLLERVDILTGGASTTYGADAVSGVVNFITKRDFAGVDASASEQITERGDGNILRADLVVGANFDDGRGNAVLALGYQKADPVFFAGERERSALTTDSFDGSGSGASGTSVPSRFSVTDVGTLQIDPATGNLLPTYQLFNFNPYNIFQTPFKRYNMFAAARYEVSDAVEVYSQGLFSQNTVNTIIAPSGTFATPFLVPINNPFLPTTTAQTLCQSNIDLNPLPPVVDGAGNVITPNILRPTPAQCTVARNPALGPGDAGYLEAPTNVSRRLIEAGGRISSYRTQVFNFKVGARGNISPSTTYDVYGSYGRSENTQTILNYVFTDRVQQGLRAVNATTCRDTSNACVPINLFGNAGSITPDQVNFLLVPASSGQRASLGQVHGVITQDLGSIGDAQPITIAAGAEYRKYTAEVFADLLAQDPGALGGAGGATVPAKGGFDVVEGFGEIVAPLIANRPFFQSLTVEAGLRYSKYRVDAPGNPKFDAWTYKGGLTWKPVDSLKLRGNYQHAVRAPSIFELFSPDAVGLVNLKRDPCQTDGTTILATSNLGRVCAVQRAPVNPGGFIAAFDPPSAGQINGNFTFSTDLKPEKADTYTFGAIFQPTFVPRLTVSVDYYNIKVKNALSTPAVGDILTACFANLTAASATSAACTSILRDPATGGLDGDASTTPGVPQPLTNSGKIATDGIDLIASWNTPITEDVRLALSFSGNYTLHSKFQATPGGINRECVGYYSINCSLTGSILPKYSFNQRTTLSVGGADVSLLWRYLSSTKQEPLDADTTQFGTNGPAFGPFQRIKAANYFDLTTRFNVTDNFDLTLTAINVLDKKPPTVGSNIGSTTFNSGNTYPQTYDAIGRRYAATARIRF